MAAAAVIGFGLLAAPSAVGRDLGPFDPTGVPLGDPDVYSVEVYNHVSVGFSVEVDVGPEVGDPLIVLVCVISNLIFPLVGDYRITILSCLLFVGRYLFPQILRLWEFRIIRTTSNSF